MIRFTSLSKNLPINSMTEINQDLIVNRDEIYETFRKDQENEDLARIRGEVESQVQLLLNF
jgi:hypothetical protein